MNHELIRRQLDATKIARQLIAEYYQIPDTRLAAYSEHRLDAIYIQLIDIKTKQSFDFRLCNQTRILERWNNLNPTKPHPFIPKPNNK